jgi:AcrR family transcriptional regulator
MARQVRSEATRRKILGAAIDVFGEVGYAAAGWSTIIERTGMTKGALYHHFDSKESLASTIIEEGSNTVLVAFRDVCGSSSPALENMIHGTFTMANVISSDKVASAAQQLTAALSGFNDAAANFCADLVEQMAGQARRASAEGDVRQELDPVVIGETVVGAMLGTRLLRDVLSAKGVDEDTDGSAVRGVSRDLASYMGQVWDLLLVGIVAEVPLPYFRQFLARETLRHSRPIASHGDAVAVPEIS